MTILEEKHEFERARAEEERRRLANQNDDYTSLYWNPEGGEGVAKSENEYEVVEENNSNLFGGGILRGIRESLLRELRTYSSLVFTNSEFSICNCFFGRKIDFLIKKQLCWQFIIYFNS